MDVIQQQPRGRSSPSKSKHKKDSFADFDDSTSDAWEVNDDELMFMTSKKLSIESQGTRGHNLHNSDLSRGQRSQLGHVNRLSAEPQEVANVTAQDARVSGTSVPSSQYGNILLSLSSYVI